MKPHPSSYSQSIEHSIGNTPLVRLNRVVPDGCAEVFVKLESFNPTGSYKDRMARSVIAEAEKRGDLQPGMRVVEATGGSTGSSLALFCIIKGYAFTAVSSDGFSEEKLRTMRALGGEVEIIPSEGGALTAELFGRMIERVQELAQDPEIYWVNQFGNPDVKTGYRPLGLEILEQVPESIDIFTAAVGTAGMLMGAVEGLRSAGCEVEIVALEPASSPILSAGRSGKNRIEGVGMGFVTDLYDPSLVDRVLTVGEEEAWEMARRLAREEGIFAGASSGMNVAGAISLAVELGEGHTIVTVAVDSGLKYLAGDLFGN